ncbi:MAG: hypothetical protein ISR50_16560 [Alphaproteobacteria bacterium]|nr:hypothetical protein [Alphaproteobacteria bacterium]
MLRKLEFTFTDGAVNPECHVRTVAPLFDGDGKSAGQGPEHVAVVAVADAAGIDAARLTDGEKASVQAQIADTRARWPLHVRRA